MSSTWHTPSVSVLCSGLAGTPAATLPLRTNKRAATGFAFTVNATCCCRGNCASMVPAHVFDSLALCVCSLTLGSRHFVLSPGYPQYFHTHICRRFEAHACRLAISAPVAAGGLLWAQPRLAQVGRAEQSCMGARLEWVRPGLLLRSEPAAGQPCAGVLLGL